MKLKLIDKDAVVDEMERKKLNHVDLTEFNSGYKNAILDVLSFLDTLEVKEVELDKPFEGIKVQTSMESGSLDEVIITTKYKAQKGERS